MDIPKNEYNKVRKYKTALVVSVQWLSSIIGKIRPLLEHVSYRDRANFLVDGVVYQDVVLVFLLVAIPGVARFSRSASKRLLLLRSVFELTRPLRGTFAFTEY